MTLYMIFLILYLIILTFNDMIMSLYLIIWTVYLIISNFCLRIVTFFEHFDILFKILYFYLITCRFSHICTFESDNSIFI